MGDAVDKLSAERRSANMRQIRSKNTAPEIVLRSLVHHLGYRFRLHRKDLPGKPDLVFPGRRKSFSSTAVFGISTPTAGRAECRAPGAIIGCPNLKRNRIRDAENQALLEEHGWGVLVIWECELKDPKSVTKKLKRFLGGRDGDRQR